MCSIKLNVIVLRNNSNPNKVIKSVRVQSTESLLPIQWHVRVRFTVYLCRQIPFAVAKGETKRCKTIKLPARTFSISGSFILYLNCVLKITKTYITFSTPYKSRCIIFLVLSSLVLILAVLFDITRNSCRLKFVEIKAWEILDTGDGKYKQNSQVLT